MAFALFRNKQIGIKKEAVNGMAETLVVGDYGIECTDISATPNPEVIDKRVYRASISATPSRMGKISATVELAGELKNSGVLNTKAKIADILESSRLVGNIVKELTVGTVVGSITRGVTIITGSTSGAKGVALLLDGTKLYVKVTSGNFATESITGVGGFSAVVSAVGVTNAGIAYTPSSTEASEITSTVKVLDGGLDKIVYGCASTLAFNLSTESYPTWTATYTGIADVSDWGTKGTPMADVVYEDHNPPIVVNAILKIGASFAPVTSSIEIDVGNTVTLVDNLNNDRWLEYAIVTERNGTGTLNILADLDESADLYQKFFAGQTAALEFKIGSGAGNQIDVIIPAIQYTGLGESDSNSLLAQGLNFKVTGADNELTMWFR